jgi:hypothetical protein
VHLLTEQEAVAPVAGALGNAAAKAALPGATGITGARLAAAAAAEGSDEKMFGPNGIFTATFEMLKAKNPHAELVRLGAPT